jgi:hypothetical protein
MYNNQASELSTLLSNTGCVFQRISYNGSD